jgi:serine phosphatase RsbU (regulator of sigma subunit)/anti-sigma regulatory factor (Ser/Thr protein kinase)
MARMVDVTWQADAAGNVTNIISCRQNLPIGDGELDENEVQQLEQRWRKCARVVERFAGVYHVRRHGVLQQTFLMRAVPVLDERDAVLYWSGIAAETDGLPEADTRFISEAATVLSSSLNRTTIINRLIQTSIDRFCDLCAVHTFRSDGSLYLEGIADSRPETDLNPQMLEENVQHAMGTRQPLLLTGTQSARSTIVVPLFVGVSCIGALTFVESERSTSFANRDVDLAVVVARQLAMALENIKTFEREQQITERFRFLARVTDRLFTSLDPAKMLQALLERLGDGFADSAIAATLENGRLRIAAAVGTKGRFRETAEGELLEALQERRPLRSGTVSDVGRAARLPQGPFFESTHPRGWMMAPLLVGDSIYGAIVCCSNSRAYDPGELELLEEIGRRASLALEHAESFARERRLIETLQQATLPTRLATVRGASLSAIYRPAASEVQVGGDWYDAFDLDEHRVLITVGDVTGHGLEASIVMGKLRHAINVVAMYEPDPVRILDAAERILLRRYPGSVATAFAAIFDARLRTIVYANAGHPYPILRRIDGAFEELEAEGLPIGLRSAGPAAKPVTLRVADAALLVFYTDGLVEATRDMIAGERRLHEAIASEAVFYVDRPAEFVEKFCLSGEQPRDDVAVLLLNFVESERWAFDSSEWNAARDTRRRFVASLAAAAGPESDLKAAELIFGELVANVARYAGGRIEVALEWSPKDAVLHVIDRGDAYAGTSGRGGDAYAGTSGREGDLFTEHGRGLWLIQRLGAQLSFEILPGYGTHVTAVLPVTRG